MSTSPLPNRVIYSDFYTDMNKHPLNDDLLKKTNEYSVGQSLRNLILTDHGERLFQPTLGGNIRRMLFDNFTPQTVITAKQMIINCAKDFEPRANIHEILINANLNMNKINITIVYSTINITQPITLEVILERLR